MGVKGGGDRPLVGVDVCSCREKEAPVFVIFDKLMGYTYYYHCPPSDTRER